MCAKGKCCFCLELETGTFIYAILNMIFVSLGLIASVCAVIVWNVLYEILVDKDLEDAQDILEEIEDVFIGINLLLSILIISFIISFVFAIVLLVGSCKNNPKHLKAYFVFGMMKILMGLLCTCLAVSRAERDHIPLAFIPLIPASIYSPFLVMIRMTYLKIEAQITYLKLHSPLALKKY